MNMVKSELEEAQEFLDQVVEEVHGRFINEDDFLETGIDGYRNFVENYISYKYEPLIEEYEEARY